jgi:hypothetical protein
VISSVAAPLQLSRGMVVDLSASGLDSLAFDAVTQADVSPLIIVFSPKGSVDAIYIGNSRVQTLEPVHLLIGKWDRMMTTAPNLTLTPQPYGPVPADDGLWNWQDLANLWVTVNARSGLVSVSENAEYFPPSPMPANLQPPANFDFRYPHHRLEAFRNARRLALDTQVAKGER